MSLSLDDVLAAERRIAGGVVVSPCPESIPLAELCGMQIFCKLDYLQRTGSFKERGARNALLLLLEAGKTGGVVAASAGNHALGLAYHGKLLGVAVTVVMPRFAPLIKITTCRRLGATVVLHGDALADARAKAEEIAVENKLTYVHGYDDPAIIAGQGTIGLEVLRQVPDVEAVVVPVGGGGLIAGVGLAIKSQRPDVQIIGVQPAHAACFEHAMAAGRPVLTPLQPTLADGLAVSQAGNLAFEVARPHVDRLVTVSEQWLSLAVLRLAELEKSVVEGAGAAALAACISGQLPELAGRRVVLLLSGGNIDPIVLSRVIEKGLVADGRLCRFVAVVSDRPGGLARLTAAIASVGASIQQLTHDRAFSGPDVSAVNVLCAVETADHQHIRQLCLAIADAGIQVLPAVGGANELPLQ